ncbi:MFS transporter [Mycobacterium sp. pV006]|uniref:MFS transporter n=1 Tax=Mycobacterium sp. pV006 TaxID=3238983 RepID=UPI00351BDA6E
MAPQRPDAARAGHRRARVAVAAVFLTNGALYANLLPRFPEIKSELGMSNALFGAGVGAFSAGALLAGLTAGALIRRFGSARVALVTTYLLAAFLVAAAAAPTPLLFATAMFVAGAGDAVTDVAQNVNGLRLQREYGRSIINSLHAVWALGAIIGGLMGAAAIASGVDRDLHLGISAVVFSVVTTVAYRHLLRGPDHEQHPSRQSPPGAGAGLSGYALLMAFVALAIAGVTVEDAGNTWATIYLRDSLAAPAALAPMGYVALVTFLFIGRLTGDRLVDRFGERTVARCGGLLTAVGMGYALMFPSIPATIFGFAVAGLGVATVVPAAMRAADELPGLRPGTGLTVLSWLMRGGLLAAPLAVGVIADATSLRVGLLTVPVAGLLLVVLGGMLGARRRAGPA